MSTLLLVAAESREFGGLLRRVEWSKKLSWPLQFARSAAWNGLRFVLVANGPGTRLARRALDVAEEREKELNGVISTGFCGALDPRLRVGGVLVASRVLAPALNRAYNACLPHQAPPHTGGEVVSVDRVAITAAEKSALRSTGAAAVEMEAGAVAERAFERGWPFYCVRAVSDASGDDMPLDFNALRDREGRFSRPRIVAAALRRPFRAIPGLIELHRNRSAAAQRLGDFLLDCRF